MTIGFDARLWSQSGVGRYIRNLLINLHEIDDKNHYVLFVNDVDLIEVESKIYKQNWKVVKTNLKWHSFSEQIYFPRIISKEKLDLIHFPYFNVPIFYKGKYIVTIHDLILHHFISGKSSTLPIWLYGFKVIAYKTIMNIAAKNSKKIIAVSNSTKNEIVDHLISDKNKVNVIYEASDDLKNSSNLKNEYEKYFLYVGNIYKHKNIEILVECFKDDLKNEDVKLLFVGKSDFFYEKLKKSLKKYKERIIFVENANDELLSGLYKNAQALIRPSLMEGFSLPPLEAISNKCIALVSDIPVHREILKDGAIYFDPNDKKDLLDKIRFTLNIDQKEKQKIIETGLQIANNFSWAKTAKQTLFLYESIFA